MFDSWKMRPLPCFFVVGSGPEKLTRCIRERCLKGEVVCRFHGLVSVINKNIFKNIGTLIQLLGDSKCPFHP